MSKFFSNTSRSFYWLEDLELFTSIEQWPEDAVEISDADWQMFHGPAPIYQIPAVDESGVMFWVDEPGIDRAALTLKKNTETLARLERSVAEKSFPLLSAVALQVATDEQKTALLRNQQYALALAAVDLTLTEPNWPTL
ncbi:tail fiber assembly protein [Dryocola sp. BD626]|uniref:tail fiber assembly protein n=1 Tax=Dryocola sp. BD626 TaxID=3133273 RepID=UPI003F4FDCE7